MGGSGASAGTGCLPAGCCARKDVPDPTFTVNSATAQARSRFITRRVVSAYLSARNKTVAGRKFLLFAAGGDLLLHRLLTTSEVGAADVPDETLASLARSV